MKKFITNLYNPKLPDFYEKIIKNKQKFSYIKKIIDECLSEIEIGDPRPTEKYSKEELLKRNIVGIWINSDNPAYLKAKTFLYDNSLFSFNDIRTNDEDFEKDEESIIRNYKVRSIDEFFIETEDL